MNKLKLKRKAVAMLLTFVMVLSMLITTGDFYEDPLVASAAAGIPGTASGPNTGLLARAYMESSVLSNFVTSVVMIDPSIPPPNQILPSPPGSGGPILIGQTYRFNIRFAENPNLQLIYNSDGVLTYQLPSALVIPSAVSQTPILASGNQVGWYTIDTSGLVSVWFGNFDQLGDPSENNYIDLTDVVINLQIDAELTAGSGGDSDFGNNIVINVPPPIPPPPALTLTKTSNYDPTTERIYYSIVIAAQNAPVSNITLNDTPTIGATLPGTNISNSFDLTVPNNPSAFYGFRYSLNGSTSFTPMNVTWATAAPPLQATSPASFSYNFTGLTLAPGSFITVMYYLDIPLFIQKNAAILGTNTLLNYNFVINNLAVANSPDVPGPIQDTTQDPIRKTFPITKSGSVNGGPPPPGTPYYIEWTISAGDGALTLLNPSTPGVITDTLGSGLFFTSTLTPSPLDSTIIRLYDDTDTVIFSGSPNQLNSLVPTTPYFRITPAAPNDNMFTFSIPPQSAINPLDQPNPFDEIYKVEIVFRTMINAPPHQGQPGIIYDNNVNMNLDDTDVGSGGRVPLTPQFPTNNLTKTTSGICGFPIRGAGRPGAMPLGPNGERYWIDYSISLIVPAGLLSQPLYLYDTLGISPGGSGVTNNPIFTSVTATDTASGDPLTGPGQDLLYFVRATGNTWTMYFGTTVLPAFAGGTGTDAWQYNTETTIDINYRIFLSDATVTTLMNSPNPQLSNSVYLINNLGPPNINAGGNSVIGKNVTDSWPIVKTSTVSAGNPALFNYTVTIKGGYSSRPTGLLDSGTPPPTPPPPLAPTNPVYTDVFDARMVYVPNSFYVVDSSNGRIYAPPLGTDADIITGNSISVNLRDLDQYLAPPDGSTSGSTPTDTSWYAYKRNYVVHYQLEVTALEIPQARLANTASIAVNNNECTFESSAMVNYTPNPLSKSFTTNDTDLIKADIVINPDGGVVFSPPPPATPPDLVTAKDVLQNMIVYTDTIQFYSQTRTASGTWDGRWIPMPVYYNDDIAWSVNIISQAEIDFVIPNRTPVKITYDAMCTLPPGVPGTISNTISIYGSSDGEIDDNYLVGSSEIGASASNVPLRIFKRDPINAFNLADATFELYVTQIDLAPPWSGEPPLNLPHDLTIGAYSFGLLQTATTDMLGVALFDDIRITAHYRYLFLLVETIIPDGYSPMGSLPPPYDIYTFFTIDPELTYPLDTAIADAETALEVVLGPGVVINPTSDFLTIDNEPDAGIGGTLRIRKLFWEQGASGYTQMTEQQVLNELSNLRIIVTDPAGVPTTFTIQDLLSPGGAVIDISAPAFQFGGVFMVQETGGGRGGYSLRTNPQLPIHPFIWPNIHREVVIQISNIYTFSPHRPRPPTTPEPPTESGPSGPSPQTGDGRSLVIPIVILTGGAVLIVGAEVYRRRFKKGKIK